MKQALIFGAGGIGRGFVGHLLHRSGFALHFVDADEHVVNRLNRDRAYDIAVAGNAASESIPVASAHHTSELAVVSTLGAVTDVLFSCVGARNVESAAATIADALRDRSQPLNWFVCENTLEPATRIREVVHERSSAACDFIDRGSLGIVETIVLRTAMTTPPDTRPDEPLLVRVSDWWTLPADADAIVDPLPPIEGLSPRSSFANELRRKIFTFNGLNGPIAYVGYARGHRLLHEASNAPRMQQLIREVMAESAHGLVQECGFDSEEHAEFQALALEKYRDPDLEDTLERNARDSLRKLGSQERLVGPAELCFKHGLLPVGYARAIAAALDYSGSSDTGTQRLQRLLATQGVETVLETVCGLVNDSPLRREIAAAWREKTYL